MTAGSPRRRPWRVALGAKSRKAGRAGEAWAAAWLMLKGYQILGFRLKAGKGDIDLLARRGRVLAVVEVKRRATPELALEALLPDQRDRLLAAARTLMMRRKSLAKLELRLDVVALSPGRWPRHFRGLIVDSAPTP